MAETPKLSVEKALEKLRGADAPKSKNARRTEELSRLGLSPGNRPLAASVFGRATRTLIP
jgi:hypothetical protein